MITRNVSVRLPKDDLAWVELLARHNQIRVSAMLRALIHGLRIAAAEGRVVDLDMGRLMLSDFER